jgi:hypothetical protein
MKSPKNLSDVFMCQTLKDFILCTSKRVPIVSTDSDTICPPISTGTGRELLVLNTTKTTAVIIQLHSGQHSLAWAVCHQQDYHRYPEKNGVGRVFIAPGERSSRKIGMHEQTNYRIS